MNKIAIIITAFCRDELLYKSVQSTVDNCTNNCINNFEIIVIDQGYTSIHKRDWLQERNVHYCPVSFDSGLSFCRNFGVKKAKELECNYVVIGSDSFLFNESLKKLNKMIDIIQNTKYSLIGFELKNCTCGWEASLNLIERKCFELDFIDKDGKPALVRDVTPFWKVDICRNFFLATVGSLLLTEWDEKLKLAEHEDFFWRFKQNGFKCLWTNAIDGEKINDRPAKYANYRRINFNEGLAYLRTKWGLSGWVEYKNLERAKHQ